VFTQGKKREKKNAPNGNWWCVRRNKRQMESVEDIYSGREWGEGEKKEAKGVRVTPGTVA
jgi:hypothetical protein